MKCNIQSLHHARPAVHTQSLSLCAVVRTVGVATTSRALRQRSEFPCPLPGRAPVIRLDRSLVVSQSAAGAMALPNDDARGSSDAIKEFFARVRAIMFFSWSMLLALPLFVSMLCLAPFVMLFDKSRRLGQHFVNNLWAKASTSPFYGVEVVGRENLPPPEKAVVYVANHQSFLDIYSLFHLNRPFKFISKTSNFLIPIVGWSMFLTGHVMINRVDRRSQLECLKQCITLLGLSAPVLFFPEGTRSKDLKLAGFKKGAFSVAQKAGVEVVPITLVGTGNLMPTGKESRLYPGGVRIVVHPPIASKGKSADEVCALARKAVASALPAHMIGEDKESTETD